MKQPAKKTNDKNSLVRMSLTSDDIKTLYLSNEKYVREVIDVCANMSEKDRLIILTVANTLAIMSPDKEPPPKSPVRHRQPNVRADTTSVYLHGVA